MQGLFAAFLAFAMLFSVSEAAGAQRTKPKQHSSSSAVVQTEAPQRTLSGRGTGSHRASDGKPTFRAEEIVPDISRDALPDPADLVATEWMNDAARLGKLPSRASSFATVGGTTWR